MLESRSLTVWGCYLEVIPSSFLLIGKNAAQSVQMFPYLGGLYRPLYLEPENLGSSPVSIISWLFAYRQVISPF